jgi:proliferating cell nuclear antigen PCNA
MSNTVVFRAQSIKSMLFRYLFDTLKGYISDVKIMFREDGIKITKVDSMWITYIFLSADKFESYNSKGMFVLGLDVKAFYKVIKGTTVHDKITLEITDDLQYLTIILENSIKGMTKKYELKTLDLTERIVKGSELSYDHAIKIPSKTFQETMKEMQSLGSKYVQIISNENKLIFSSDPDCDIRHDLILCDFNTNDTPPPTQPQTTELIDENIKYINYEKSTDSIIRGEYSLSYLNSFIKASSMSLYMMIYLNNSMPMVLEWPIGDLGVYRVTLHENDNTQMTTSSK